MAEHDAGVRPLTVHEMRVLTAVRVHCSRTGWPATLSDVARLVGLQGRTSVIKPVHALRDLGLLEQHGVMGVRPVGWRYAGR